MKGFWVLVVVLIGSWALLAFLSYKKRPAENTPLEVDVWQLSSASSGPPSLPEYQVPTANINLADYVSLPDLGVEQ
jgi:hypothetical protein